MSFRNKIIEVRELKNLRHKLKKKKNYSMSWCF